MKAIFIPHNAFKEFKKPKYITKQVAIFFKNKISHILPHK